MISIGPLAYPKSMIRTAPGLALLAFALVSPRLSPAQVKPATVTVSAQGSVRAQPDTAVVQFQVSGSNAELKTAYAAAEQQARQLRTQLREQGFTPAQARWSQYSVTPDWDYRTHHILSYSVSAGVQLLLTDFGRIAPLIHAFSGSGSTTLRSVSFELRKSAAARRQAIAAAYTEAHAQAAALAAAAGLKLGPLASASVNAGGLIAPRVRLMAAAAMPAPVSQFTPQSLQITASVTAVYQLVRP
jgi:uncharacterized protein YggE